MDMSSAQNSSIFILAQFLYLDAYTNEHILIRYPNLHNATYNI